MDDRKKRIEASLKSEFERELNNRVERAYNLKYLKVIGGHHFAAASWECLKLYRDGFWLGTIMGSQSVVEALIKFVAERSKSKFKGEFKDIIRELKEKNIISNTAMDSALQVWRHRNDFHHLNPGISAIELKPKAEECIKGLCQLEEEIFGGQFIKGKLLPNQPQYYDISSEGHAPMFLRQFDL